MKECKHTGKKELYKVKTPFGNMIYHQCCKCGEDIYDLVAEFDKCPRCEKILDKDHKIFLLNPFKTKSKGDWEGLVICCKKCYQERLAESLRKELCKLKKNT